MSYDNYLSSDDSSDTFTLDLHVGRNIQNESILCRDWNSIEHTLYQEGGKCHLNPKLIHECRLWRESFPHLRVHGQRIENPYSLRKDKLKHQIISQVVDQIIDRINGGALNIGKEKGIQQKFNKKEESYFERGKSKPVINTVDQSVEEIKIVSTNSSTSTTPREDKTHFQPRGILKSSSSQTPHIKARERRRKCKDSTSVSSFRNTSLPKISPKTNNWLYRGEKFDPLPSRRSHDYPQPKKYLDKRRNSRFMFPPINAPSDTTS